MVTKKPGEILKVILSIKHQGLPLPYRLECALGACGLGGCAVPGSGFTIETGLHFPATEFTTVRHDTPTEIVEQANLTIPSNTKLKKYDARVWITYGKAPYDLQWEARIGDAVEIVAAVAPPPETTWGNSVVRFS